MGVLRNAPVVQNEDLNQNLIDFIFKEMNSCGSYAEQTACLDFILYVLFSNQSTWGPKRFVSNLTLIEFKTNWIIRILIYLILLLDFG